MLRCPWLSLFLPGWEQSGILSQSNVPLVPLGPRGRRGCSMQSRSPRLWGQDPHWASGALEVDVWVSEDKGREETHVGPLSRRQAGQQLLPARDPAASSASPGPKRHLADGAGRAFPSGSCSALRPGPPSEHRVLPPLHTAATCLTTNFPPPGAGSTD